MFLKGSDSKLPFRLDYFVEKHLPTVKIPSNKIFNITQ